MPASRILQSGAPLARCSRRNTFNAGNAQTRKARFVIGDFRLVICDRENHKLEIPNHKSQIIFSLAPAVPAARPPIRGTGS